MTLYWHETGPLIAYGDGMLVIEDLNPQQEIKWRMSRLDLLKLAGKALWAAIRG